MQQWFVWICGLGLPIIAQNKTPNVHFIISLSGFPVVWAPPLSDLRVLMKMETFDGQSDFVISIQP